MAQRSRQLFPQILGAENVRSHPKPTQLKIMSDLISIPKLTLWVPDAPSLLLPTPLVFSHPPLSSEEDLLRESLEVLICPSDYEDNPHWQTTIGKFFLIYKSKVVGQFIRKNLDKKFKDLEMARRLPKSFKQQINWQADLMSQIWRIIKLLPPPPKPRPIVFHYVISESALIFFQFLPDETGEEAVTNLMKKQQSFNRSLESLDENPFDPKVYPETWSFVDICNREAARNDKFHSDYMELVRMRMILVRSLKEDRPKRFDQSGQSREKRGRKSIPSSRKLSG